jgi:hypothetical protein
MKKIIITLATLFVWTAPAAAQRINRIQVDTKEEGMTGAPLSSYLTIRKNFDRYMKYSNRKCGLSGYRANWEIKNDKLFLTKLSIGCSPESRNQISLDQLFPEQNQPVFADWYSGTLTVPRGELIPYLDSLRNRQELVMDIKAGVVVQQRIQENYPLELKDVLRTDKDNW